MKNKLFIILAFVFVIPAIFHAFALFFPLNDSPVWRNLLWVFLNLLLAYGVYTRPKFFVYVFALLIIQQFISHGSDLVHLWKTQHKVDWISVSVFIYLPVVFIFLIRDRLGKIDNH